MEDLALCINYLQEKQCVLFLGPQFAVNATGEKVHVLLKEHLKKKGYQEKLDFEFDNLYIFKDPRPRSGEKMLLNIELKNFYRSIQPHPVYSQIPYIPFQAVISCSPDLFLKDAFEKEGIDLQFQYYSHKGSNSTPLRGDATILYNLFGNIADEDSLLTTYEYFYKFFISILGDEQKIPIDLQNALAEAKLFVFYGFDLTKWYIPLLIHKLNVYREKENRDFATALINRDNKRDVGTDRFYPIELLIFEEDTIPMIGAIYRQMEENQLLRKPRKNGTEYKSDAAMIRDLIAAGELEEALEMLHRSYARRMLDPSQVILLQAKYTNLLNDQSMGTISYENEQLELARVRKVIMDYTKVLD